MSLERCQSVVDVLIGSGSSISVKFKNRRATYSNFGASRNVSSFGTKYA